MDIDTNASDEDDALSPNDTNHQAPTPSQRIAELNQIDHSISTLLTSASTATSVLSNTSINTSTTSPSSLSSAQSQFTNAAQTYFSTLSSIEVRLRRQVYALEEAGLIPAGDERDMRRGRTLNDEDGAVRRGGGGPLDPSWLNARASEGVEVGMRKEVLKRGKELLAEIEKGKRTGVEEKRDIDMTT